MKTLNGDLIKLAQEGVFDVIIHGCNCQNTMGAGIAKTIKQHYPQAYEADLETVKGDRSKLGTFTQSSGTHGGFEFIIVNAYTQFYWRGRGLLVDYDAIRSVFELVKECFGGKRIGYPLIGAGLARGDWDVISSIIDEQLDGENHSLVLWDK